MSFKKRDRLFALLLSLCLVSIAAAGLIDYKGRSVIETPTGAGGIALKNNEVINADRIGTYIEHTAAPTATDDINGPQGAAYGNTLWKDTNLDRLYLCLDNTDGAAAWREFVIGNLDEEVVLGSDTGDALQWGYALHVSVDDDGKGIHIGEENEGDNGEHPAFISTAHIFSSDTGDLFRGIHNEYQWRAQNSGNIINAVHTAKFTPAGGATYTQTDVRGLIIQLESDNENLTITQYIGVEIENPKNWNVAGTEFQGTLGRMHAILVREQDVASTVNNALYTVGGSTIFVGGDSDLTSTGAGLVTVRDATLAQLSLEYENGKEWHFRTASAGALIIKNDGVEALRIAETNMVGIDCAPVYPLQVNGGISGLEKSTDPTEPAEGSYVIWMSDGTGSKGDDGDVLIASQAGGVTKWTTLFDHSAGDAW